MYAVIRQGGHQYRVAPGDVIQVEKIDVEKGDEVEIEDVLLVGKDGEVEIGEPRVAGATVKAKVLRQGRGKKIQVFKFRKRKGFEKRYGHRQPFVELKITAITKDGQALA